jgi:hypothetical protein
VLARYRAAEFAGEREQAGGGALGALKLDLILEIDQERRVDVAVARVAPAARLQPVSHPDHGWLTSLRSNSRSFGVSASAAFSPSNESSPSIIIGLRWKRPWWL